MVENPQTNEDLEVLSGKVRHHSKDRDGVYRKAVNMRPSEAPFFTPARFLKMRRLYYDFTFEVPEDAAVVL